MPRDLGILHNDNVDNPNGDELASVGLTRAWNAAQNAARSICEGCCCKSVTIVVKCDKDMKEMTRKLYVKGMHDLRYPKFDWCRRKETISCANGTK